MEKCESKGISTEYEKINCAVIERFEEYINEEYANNGEGDEEIADFNKSYCDNLYTQTKETLEAYLDGTKSALSVNMADAINIKTNGNQIYSDDKPFYGIGYGHFEDVVRDMENFNGFGANNIQIEVGTTYVTRNRCGWTVSKWNNVDADAEITDACKYDGEYSLHITNNTASAYQTYYHMYRDLDCIPGDVYQFAVYGKGNLSGMYIELDAWNKDARVVLEDSDEWKLYLVTYTIPEGVTQIRPQIISNDITDGYLDNMIIKKKSSGNTNLLLDGSFESGDELYANLEPMLTALENGEKNNVGVNVLLSPHYFPRDLSSDIYKTEEAGWFHSFNVNHPTARSEVERYLRTLLPYMQGKSCLNSIIISNEPQFDTRDFSDYYTEQFQDYLTVKHGGSLDEINDTLGTSYTDVCEISMPEDDEENRGLYWDWVNFNDAQLNAWHQWMADIVKEYLPDIPISSKLLNYAGGGYSDGRDLEVFDSWSDWSGCDIVDYYKKNQYYNSVFYYDYLASVTDKPIYDSENHLTGENSGEYSETNKLGKHIYNSLWQGAMHGRNMTSIWYWQRGLDENSDRGENSRGILYHADAVAEIGKVSLDLMRLGKELEAFKNKNADVAIYYSKPTLINTGRYSILEKVYEVLVQNGYKVGVVSDKSIDRLKEYSVLIIPGGDYTTEEMLAGVNKFIDKGGKVAYASGISPMKYNEYGQELDNGKLVSNATACSTSSATDFVKFVKSAVNPRVTIQVKTKALIGYAWKDISNVSDGFDWKAVIEDGRALLNISNRSGDKEIRIFIDGKLMTNMRDLISGEKLSDDIELEQYEPKLVEIPLDGGIDGATFADGTINWTPTGANYLGAEIYKVDNTGNLVYAGKQKYGESSYTVDSDGLYMIKPIGTASNASKEIIQVNSGNVFSIEILNEKIDSQGITCKVKVENITESYGRGNVCVQALKGGTVENFICCDVMIPGNQTKEMNFSVSLSEADSFKVMVWDSLEDKNLISNEILR